MGVRLPVSTPRNADCVEQLCKCQATQRSSSGKQAVKENRITKQKQVAPQIRPFLENGSDKVFEAKQRKKVVNVNVFCY